MKRKQKRFLQMTLIFMVALIFLPNIGLWSLYKDKHLVKSTEPGEQQVSGPRRMVRLQPQTQPAGVRSIALGLLPSLSRAYITRL